MMVICCAFLQGGWTALHIAAKHNNADVVNVLLKNDPTLTKQTDIVSEQLMIIHWLSLKW